MYKVYYLNRYVRRFGNRDAAIQFVMDACSKTAHTNFEDFEILDGSDRNVFQ